MTTRAEISHPSRGPKVDQVIVPPKPLVIAIDGPSGSGKSSVSRAVAQRLNLAYLDTGAMFRALTWWCLHRGIDLDDQSAVTRAAKALPLYMGTDPASPSVQVAGVSINEAIRESVISELVSKVAVNLGVRDELCSRQRALIAESVRAAGGVVAEGRDITTVVAPDARVRILLSANQQARLSRRAKELHGEDSSGSVTATHDQIVRRDKDDSTVSQFMHAAPGVTLVDTSDLDLQQSVQAVLDVVYTQNAHARKQPPAAEGNQKSPARGLADEGRRN